MNGAPIFTVNALPKYKVHLNEVKVITISEIIDFVLGNSSPRMSKSLGEKRVTMGGTVRPPF
jgi:hypothetical protein